MTMEIPEVWPSDIPDPVPDDLLVVDVREPAEWAGGHIEGAVHIPLMDVPARLSDLPHDRRVLVVCAVGARSARAAAFLNAQGFDAVNLAGGVMAWWQSGRPLVVDD
jgi:rhodanese-related sulfurtransferase